MLKVRAGVMLDPNALADLAGLQARVDAETAYPSQVAAAKRHWENARKTEPPFDEVKRALAAMCWGHRRCAYCEDSLADEIEHFWPKDLYPERVFVWENYLYACGPCNGPKSNRFAVIPPGAHAVVEVSRAKGTSVVPPVAGTPALLDPRVDDPLDYLELDLSEFRFTERPGIAPDAWARARYTISTLGLNDRSFVIEARGTAYDALCTALDAVPARVARGAPLTHVQRTIQNTTHRSVWEEMKRQHLRIAELTMRFAAAPQALDW